MRGLFTQEIASVVFQRRRERRKNEGRGGRRYREIKHKSNSAEEMF